MLQERLFVLEALLDHQNAEPGTLQSSCRRKGSGWEELWPEIVVSEQMLNVIDKLEVKSFGRYKVGWSLF